MEENNQITDNCKVFIEQYIYCKNKAIDKYKKKSDFIIENNQTIEKLRFQIEKIIKII